MTLAGLLSLAWRYRLVSVACALLTGAAMCLLSPPVVAWNARVSVVLLVPPGSPGNPLASTTTSLIATTGVVARNVNGPDDAPQTVSSELNPASTATVPGWSLRQPNAGGQWDVNYEEPRLDVKAWGHTSEQAQAQVGAALTAINRSLEAMQDEQGVSRSQRIRVSLSPARPVLTAQRGSRVRALAGTATAGLLTTLGLLVATDRLAARRRRSTPEPGRADSPRIDELADSHR